MECYLGGVLEFVISQLIDASVSTGSGPGEAFQGLVPVSICSFVSVFYPRSLCRLCMGDLNVNGPHNVFHGALLFLLLFLFLVALLALLGFVCYFVIRHVLFGYGLHKHFS